MPKPKFRYVGLTNRELEKRRVTAQVLAKLDGYQYQLCPRCGSRTWKEVGGFAEVYMMECSDCGHEASISD